MSDTGVLLYASGLGQGNRQLTWLDRKGNVLGTIGERAAYQNPNVSPDDRNVAVEMLTGGNRDIWILSSDDKQARLTFELSER